MPTTVETADGRSLSVDESGDPTGRPVVYIHGTPGTGAPFPGHVRLAQEQGIRFVSFDRAGYAASTAAAEGFDWLGGMGEGNVQEFGAAEAGEAVVRPAPEAEAVGLAKADVDGLVEMLSSLLCPEDVAAPTGEPGSCFVQAFASALSTGVHDRLPGQL